MTLDRDPVPGARISRRNLLGGAALTCAAAALGVAKGAPEAAPAPSAGRKTSRATQTDYDVVVVGGGFSGATAARDCHKNGLRTLLVEARGRLGGRTFDTHFAGHHVELGGTWVHWSQPAVWTEILRYQLQVEETPGAVPERIVAFVEGKRTELNLASQVAEVAAGVDAYFAESGLVWSRPYDTKYRWSELAARDGMSAADRLHAVNLSPVQRDVLIPLVEAMAHCPFEQASYTEMLRWWALCLNNFGIAFDALARYKIKAGTGELVRRIAGDGAVEVRLSTPIRRIEQRGDVVIIEPRDGRPVSARAVILAVPPRVLRTLEFEPALSSGKLAASREGFTPSGLKYYVEIKGRLGNVQWFAPAKYRAGMLWTYESLPNSTLLVGFAPRSRDFDANNEESVQEVLRQFLPDAEVIASTSYSWVDDPFSLGTFSSLVPGGIGKYFEELARREGRIYMAGSDIGDNSWRGFIDGAIGRGLRIAREVTETLSS